VVQEAGSSTHVRGFHAAYNGGSVFLDMKAENKKRITGDFFKVLAEDTQDLEDIFCI
jgi:hypothetical protein